MKKFLSCIIAGLLSIMALSGCTSSTNSSDSVNNSNTRKTYKLNVVCTIFPQYDWVKQIVGDDSAETDLTLLINSGIDLHSYQPSADDIIKATSCDVLIYTGGESDKWIDDALKTPQNKDITAINLLDILGDKVKEEEVNECMEAEEHEHDESEHDEDDHEHEMDEHIWLSLKNASFICDYISKTLSEIDSENTEKYTQNAKQYIEKLNALDQQYQETVTAAKHKTILFGDRFPFRYLADDYDLDYYAAFVGCSAETEASFETIAFLSSKLDELGLEAILTIEGTSHKIAETIVQNTQSKAQQILSLNSMQSITKSDIENGAAYLSIMEENLSTLKTALN